ncbi:hypothetical protein Efla_007538 [Eimeria flavescens]
MQESQPSAALSAPQLLGEEHLNVSRRLWVAEAAALLSREPPADFAQRIAAEKTAFKLYAEFQEVALSGAVALRERRLSPIGCVSSSPAAAPPSSSEGAAERASATGPPHVYVHNNILLLADNEPRGSHCSCLKVTSKETEDCFQAKREALRRAAQATEVARLCEDKGIAAAAAAAATAAAATAAAAAGSSASNLIKDALGWRRGRPVVGISVTVDYAGTRFLCQGMHEEAFSAACKGSPEAVLGGQAAAVAPLSQQQQQALSAASLARILGVKECTEYLLPSHESDSIFPLDVVAAQHGLQQTAGELAAAAASAAARYLALPNGEAAVAAAVGACAAVDARVKAAAAAAGLEEGPSYAATVPCVRPELLRAVLAFKSRQSAQQQGKEEGSRSSSSTASRQAAAEEDAAAFCFAKEFKQRLDRELSACCTNSPKELLFGGSWFASDCKGGSNGSSNNLLQLQQLTLECCRDTVLRCLERAKEQQELLLESRREDIKEFRAAIRRQVEKREKELQQAASDMDEQQAQEWQSQAAADAVAPPASAAASDTAPAPETASDRSSDIAILSLLGEDVLLLQANCELPARAAAAATEACSHAFAAPPGVSPADCLLLGAGTQALPLASEKISAADRENLLLLAAYLRQVAVPLAARLLSAHYPDSSPPLDSQGLKALLHRCGLNCRHLGAVSRAVEATAAESDLSLPLLLLERDVLLRCAKAHINWRLSALTMGEVAEAVAHLLSSLFSAFSSPSLPSASAAEAAAAKETALIRRRSPALSAALSETPQQFWNALRRRSWTRFGLLLPASPLESRALQAAESRHVLLRSLCASLGVQLRAEVPARLLLGQQQMPTWMLLLHNTQQQQQQQQQQAGGKLQQSAQAVQARAAVETLGNTVHHAAARRHAEAEAAKKQQQQQQQQAAAATQSDSRERCSSAGWLVQAEDVVGIAPIIKGSHLPSQAARALLAAASHCCSCGQVDAALDLLQQALCVAHQLSGAVCSLSSVTSTEWMRRMIIADKIMQGPILEAATCYAAIGHLLTLLDDPLNACNNLQKSLILLERCNGPDHPSTLEVHSALAHGFSKLPGHLYQMRSLCHMQRALLLQHAWAGGLPHPMLPLMLLGASRCLLLLQQQQPLLQTPARSPASEQHALFRAAHCARAAEAALSGMQIHSGEYRAEVYCELSWVYESLQDWRRALEWTRAARGEYVKTNADPRIIQDAEARMLRLTQAAVVEAQQQKLHQQQRELLVSRLRQTAEWKRTNRRSGITALLTPSELESFAVHARHGLAVEG